MKRISHIYSQIISVDNLLLAWQEFICGKQNKKDVLEFNDHLMDNILTLHQDLVNFQYQHGKYRAFKIFDPKPRDIHKASVRDRLVHHAVYRVLYPLYDKTFISDSYSCRNKKGTHRAINKLRDYFYKVSCNNTKTCYCLKLDIKKFFANIDHDILKNILIEKIDDKELFWLLENIIDSFHPGLPLGNLTSQLFVNIYMNEFDQFVKHNLREKYYIRYADDFIIFNENRNHLTKIIKPIDSYLKQNLKLNIHEDKIYLKTISSGIDFLGIINFTDHRILRTRTKIRMFKKINSKNQASYLGLLKHCNGYKIRKILKSTFS